ncbi:unnamed protein product, partial [Rotaria magnacalcarata]
MGAPNRITLASTASSPTLTSRLPTEISIEP